LFLYLILLDIQAMISCLRCQDPIYFDPSWVSERSGKRIPLDEYSGQPHNCTKSEYHKPHCKYCDQEITFSDNFLSKNGKRIPLDLDMQNHQCEQGQKAWEERKKSPRTYNCRLCNAGIYFDDRVSENEKHIPIEVLTNEPHKCAKKIKILPKNRF
jgi:hypothetical protein